MNQTKMPMKLPAIRDKNYTKLKEFLRKRNDEDKEGAEDDDQTDDEPAEDEATGSGDECRG